MTFIILNHTFSSLRKKEKQNYSINWKTECENRRSADMMIPCPPFSVAMAMMGPGVTRKMVEALQRHQNY